MDGPTPNIPMKSGIFQTVWDVFGRKNGAGEGNRTLVFSLEGCCSTIELHPQRAYISSNGAALNGKKHVRGFPQLFL